MEFDYAEIQIALLNKLKEDEIILYVLSSRESLISVVTFDLDNVKTYYPFDHKYKTREIPEGGYDENELFIKLEQGEKVLYMNEDMFRIYDDLIASTSEDISRKGIEEFQKQRESIEIISDSKHETQKVIIQKPKNIGDVIGSIKLKGIKYEFSRSSKGYFLTAVRKDTKKTFGRFKNISELFHCLSTLEQVRENEKSRSR